MSELENNTVVDNYQEHPLHHSPYWKTMKTCSECFKKHNEITSKSAFTGSQADPYPNYSKYHDLAKINFPYGRE